MNVVECISLTKVFQDFWSRDKVRAVDALDLEIHSGEVFGLLGPNGSGKSTTIKMLLGLLYPTSGSARVLGEQPTNTAIKARIGFMPEESYLYRYLNAYETLDYYGRLFKLDRHERRRRTDQLIDMIGLKRAGKRPVGTYSKGMARRIGLAQALINDPDLLILDEPTTGLDPIGTRQIKDVIRILGDRGKTVLLCSHLLADVEDVCDRVSVMYGGQLQAVGPVSELLERRDATQITTNQLSDETLKQVKKIVAAAGREVLDVSHPSDRLEDMFLRIVSQAQREKIETSGAEVRVGVSEFLGGASSGAELIDTLVDAGKASEPSATAETVGVVPVDVSSKPKAAVLDKLVSGEEQTTAADDVEAGPGPVESPTPRRQPDKAVLDRLLKPDDGDEAES